MAPELAMLFDEISARISSRVRRIRLKDVAAAYNLERAVRKLTSSGRTPGSDGLTIHQLQRAPEFHILSIQKLLLLKVYKPQKARKVRIRKPSGGFRTLQIPSVIDRLVGRAILEAIAPKFQPYLPTVNYAFRRGSGALDAIRQAAAAAQGSQGWMVKTDIRAFFDQVRHSILLDQLGALPIEQDLLDLLKLFFVKSSRSISQARGLPQGSVLSPFLANIYLAMFDRQVVNKGMHMVRYADDLLFMASSKAAAKKVLKTVKELLRPLDLELSMQKTLIVPASSGVGFLGLEISSDGCTLSGESTGLYQAQINVALSILHGQRKSKEHLVNYAVGWLSFYAQAVTDSSVNELVQWTVQRCGEAITQEEAKKIMKCVSQLDIEEEDWPEYLMN
jgi:RNA-directed DNA polymerase